MKFSQNFIGVRSLCIMAFCNILPIHIVALFFYGSKKMFHVSVKFFSVKYLTSDSYWFHGIVFLSKTV